MSDFYKASYPIFHDLGHFDRFFGSRKFKIRVIMRYQIQGELKFRN